jgi:hypothetical protein
MKSFRKFIPFWKVEAQSDGTVFVYGLVTAERPDQENEVCDFESTKPYYQKLVSRYEKATAAVDGMEKSIAPLREMHQLKAVGCGKSIDFDDAAKTIHMGFKVVDSEACKKVKAGVLIGFSQGGDYVKTWKKGNLTWYTADPGEVSLVDSPCLEDALIESLVEKTFTYVQENGSQELRKFSLRDPARERSLKETQDLLTKIADLEKQVEALNMKPELEKILAKLAKAGSETVTLSKEEMLELAELAKGHAAILDHLKAMHKCVGEHCAAMHKAHSDHMDEMHDHIAKCHKSIGAEPPMKAAKETGDVKKTFTKEELDAQIKAAVEKAKKNEDTPSVFTKEQAEKLVADAVEKAMKEKTDASNDPTRKAKLVLVGRDGKPIEKAASDVAVNDQSIAASSGI